MPLDRALAQLFQRHGYAFLSVVRLAKNSVRVIFQAGDGRAWYVTTTVPVDMAWTPDQLDDAIYDGVEAELLRWATAHGR